MFLCRRQLKLCKIVLLIFCSCIPALSATEITINSSQTTQQPLAEGDGITLTDTGSITTDTDSTPAILGSNSGEGSNRITLLSGSEIRTSGTGSLVNTSSPGIMVYGTKTNTSIIGLAGSGALENGASNIIVLQSGSSISTTGDSAVGILSGNNNQLTVNGTINTINADSYGIFASDNNDITLGGTIMTQSNGAAGISYYSNNNINVSGNISTYGFLASGIISNDDRNNIAISGSVITHGSLSFGLASMDYDGITLSGSILTKGYASIAICGANHSQLNISGDITTTGDEATGISVMLNNAVDFSGTITTAGKESSGLTATDNNNITALGSIITAGDAAYGISVRDNNTIDFRGSITTSGDAIVSKSTCASGIAGFDNNKITSSGTIITTGNDATGIDVFDNNRITLSGSIHTSGHWSYGIYGFDNNTINNSGDIITSGDNASGIDIEDNNIITISGDITTTGTAAHAVNLFNNNNVCNLSGTLSATGTGAYAINSGNHDPSDPAPILDSNCIHLLQGAVINGNIYNDDATATSYLTFGYAKNSIDEAVLTTTDNNFRLTLNHNILSSSTGNWDGYFAGGTTTLNGTTNTFRNIFIGGTSFTGTTVAAGTDGAGNPKTANLTPIPGTTAVLNVMHALTTSGDITVGTGSTYNLYGIHTGSGNLTLQSNSNLNLALTSRQVSRLTLNGTADFSAGNVDIAARGGQSGLTYTLIEASSIIGAINLTDYSALLDYTLDRSSGNRVYVTSYLIPEGYESASETGDGTNASIAEAMAKLSNNHPVSLDNLYLAMNEYSTFQEVNSALSQLNIINSAASTINLALSSAHRYNSILSKQLSNFQLGTAAYAYGSGTGYTSSGLSNDQASPSELKAAYSSIENSTIKPEITGIWAGFAQAYGGFGEQETNGDRSGYNYNQAGIMSGLGYIFSHELRAGGIIDYSYSTTNIYNNMGDGNDKILRLGSFVTYQWDNLFASTAPSFALHLIETNRNLNFLGTSAQGKRTGYDLNWLNTFNYKFELDNGISITPGYNLAFTAFHQPGYTENRASDGVNLRVDNYTGYSLLQTLDLKFSRLFKINDKLSILPEVWGGWELEYLDSGTDVISSFAVAQNQSWQTNITTIPSNRAIFGGAVTALINDNTSLLCRYDQKIWSGGYDVGFSIGLKISF